MSLQAEKKHLKNEMPTGTHLAFIFDMKAKRDANKNPIIKDGEMAILVTFCNGENQYHEQVYWCGKGNAGKEKYFTQMCLDAMIDMSVTPLSVKQARNKRLWIAIREVYTLVNNGEDVKKSDVTGEAIIEKFIFKTAPVFDADKKPIFKGDPALNDGVASDDFVGYVEENEDGYETMPKGDAPEFSLEVQPVTPEVEATIVVKPKKEKKVKEKKPEVLEIKVDSVSDMPNFGEPTIVMAEDGKSATINNPATFAVNTEISVIAPMPNFGEANPLAEELIVAESIKPADSEIKYLGETPGTEQKETIESVMKNVDMSQMTVIQPQESTITPLPNFGDDQTPDTNF